MVKSEKTEKKSDSDQSIFKFDKQIASNSVFSIGSTIITYGIYFIISVFLARILSVELYGSYKLVREIFKIIVIFSVPGLKIVIFKNSAQNFDGTYNLALKLRFKYSLITPLIFFIFSIYFFFIGKSVYHNDIGISLIICGLLSPFFYSTDLWKFLLKGKMKFKLFFLFEFLNTLIYFLLIFIFVFLGNITSIYFLVTFYFLHSSIFNVIVSKYCKKFLLNNKIDKNWKKQGFHLSVTELASIVFSSLDMLIVGLFLTLEQLAIYSLTFLLIESVLFLIKAGIDVFLPRIFNSSKKKKILREILIIFFLSFMVPFLIGSVIHIPIILLFTSKYIEVINYSRIFLFVIPFFILNGFIIPFLIKLNMNKEINISYIISISGTVILYFLLIPKYGIIGAIVSSISFLIILNISSLVLYGFSSRRS